jgi:tetratricopeptide (TPR) repeat protein
LQPQAGPGAWEVVPGYEVLGELGRGGMGVVYKARQLGLNRLVALKMILSGVHAGQQELARFQVEAEAVARLQHPHIVQIHEVGEVDGRPYFSLEYVEGGSLARRLNGTPWAAAPAAGLVETLARAMDYAHQRGIVHRDLKPANVLLAEDGTPKVADFGLAKHRESQVGLTATGAIVGTPSYMAPEQAGGNKEVGPPVDVYALGAVLYELLTGRPPFRAATPLDTIHQVLQEEPVPPSRLQPRVPPDLETICLKCLEKLPAKRYASAGELADELARYLRAEPIHARPVGRVERLARWCRRHPSTAALLGALATVVVLAFAGVSWSYVRAETALGREAAERHRAEQAERQALADAALARQNEEHARQAEAEARAVLQFFREHVVAAARPKDQEHGLGRDVTMRQALDAAEPSIAKAFADQPTVEAAVRASLGNSYFYLGDGPGAVRQHEKALTLRRQVLGPDHPDTLVSMVDLAHACQAAGRMADAVRLCQEVVRLQKARLAADDPELTTSLVQLADVYLAASQPKEALPIFEEVVKRWRDRGSPREHTALHVLNSLGQVYTFTGRQTEAVPLLEESLRGMRADVGPDHPDTLVAMGNLAIAYQATGRAAEAVPLLEKVLPSQRERLGPAHHDTLATMMTLAGAYLATGRIAAAVPLLEEAVEREKKVLGVDHPTTLTGMYNLGFAYEQTGDWPKVEKLYRELLAGARRRLGNEHLTTASTLASLGAALVRQGKAREAEPLLRECLAIREKHLADSWLRFSTMSLLGGSLLTQKEYAAAQPLLLQGYRGMKERFTQIPAPARFRLDEARDRLVRLYEAWGKADEAHKWRAVPDEAPSQKPGAGKRP